MLLPHAFPRVKQPTAEAIGDAPAAAERGKENSGIAVGACEIRLTGILREGQNL